MSEMTAKEIHAMSLENMGTYTGQLLAEYARKEDIPTAVSALANDAKYQTQEQVAAAVAAADHLTRKKVASLDAIDPAAEGAEKFIYMVPKTGSDEDDQYDEYMVLDGTVEHVGNTRVDLSGYVKTADIRELTAEEIHALFAETEAK